MAAGATLAAPLGVSVDVGRYVDLDWTNFRSNMAAAARVLLERARAPVAAVRRRLRGRAPVAAAGGPARRLVRGLPPRQGNAAAIDRRERQLLPPPDAGVSGLLPARGGVAVARPGRRAPDSGAAAARSAGARSPGACSPERASCFVVLPLLVISLVRPLSREEPEAITIGSILTPVDPSIEVDVRADGARRTLTWTHRDFGATKVFYRVFRTAADGARLRLPGRGLARLPARDAAARVDARASRSPTARRPTNALYRVGVATNWQNDAEGGDVIALSPPLAATP